MPSTFFVCIRATEAQRVGHPPESQAELLTNAEAGQIIGWGKTQGAAGVQVTKELTQNLTEEAVQEMIKKGLNKSTVENLKNQYARAVADSVKLEANPDQLPARLALMNKILELWPK